MSDNLAAKFKDCGHVPFLLCVLFFFFAVALFACGWISGCVAGAIIFLGLAICCCAAC